MKLRKILHSVGHAYRRPSLGPNTGRCRCPSRCLSIFSRALNPTLLVELLRMALQQHIKPEQTVGSEQPPYATSHQIVETIPGPKARRVNARGNCIAGVVEMSRVGEQQTHYNEPLNSYCIVVSVEKRSMSHIAIANASWHNHALKTRRIGQNNGSICGINGYTSLAISELDA